MATQTKSLKAVDRQAERELAKELKQWHKDRDKARSLVEDAEQRIEDVTTKQLAHHAKFVETSLAVSVKDFGNFVSHKDFNSPDCVHARIATLIKLDNAMGRISLAVAHQLGHDLIQLRIWEVPMGGWKDKVISLGMEYRRSVRYVLIAHVFPEFATLETLGITTVTAALDACGMAKKKGWTCRHKDDKSFKTDHLDDLREALTEADVDRSQYDEQHFFPAPEKPKGLDSDGESESESEATSTENESETTESEDSADTNPTYDYDKVWEALHAIRDTLLDLGKNTVSRWQEIVSAGPNCKSELLRKLQGLGDYLTTMREEIIEETTDEAPPIEHDTADDVDDVDDVEEDRSITATSLAVIDEGGIDHD